MPSCRRWGLKHTDAAPHPFPPAQCFSSLNIEFEPTRALRVSLAARASQVTHGHTHSRNIDHAPPLARLSLSELSAFPKLERVRLAHRLGVRAEDLEPDLAHGRLEQGRRLGGVRAPLAIDGEQSVVDTQPRLEAMRLMG